MHLERLTSWLDSQGLEVGEPVSIEQLTGGRSNVMFGVDRGAARWVLRRPAAVAVDRADDGMRREFRILDALRSTDVPHPAVVALCDDPEVLGCTWYLMERIEGVNPMPTPPALADDHHRGEIARSVIEALARIHQVDWRSVGLADLGRPDEFHQRQVSRWSRQLASYEGRELPRITEVMQWLEANRPTAFEPTLMHGDFHMLNIMIAPDTPGRVLAVLDWETTTIGDPLLDLAGFSEVWSGLTSNGWPSSAELIEHYWAVRNLAAVEDLTYYKVLYNFRLAVLLEGIYQRSLRDPTRLDQHEVGERALVNAARAHELAAGHR